MLNTGRIFSVRKYSFHDREAVRRISCETSFLQEERKRFIDDDEILADALTLYFTDYEPGSCFVAVDSADKVIGYLLGARRASLIPVVFIRSILPGLLVKALRHKIFLKNREIGFFMQVLISLVSGEFITPRILSGYPAVFHINIESKFRRINAGKTLVERYLRYLYANAIYGVHCGTMSGDARDFFIAQGFTVLHSSRRTYLKYLTGKSYTLYLLGRRISFSGLYGNGEPV
jgi:hypothetical protein